MKVFVSGATGFIGARLVKKLAEENHQVTVLVRNNSDAENFLKEGMKVVTGDIFDVVKLNVAMDGCDWVFHLAAYARPATSDNLPFRTNVEGTENILNAAKKNKVKKVIVTSTAGTIGTSKTGLPLDENSSTSDGYSTEYEKTKAIAEKIAFRNVSDQMEVVVVNPSRVFGPGKLSVSNSVTKIIKLYGEGLWRIMPGDGTAIGNYTFIDDVVKGCILAARYGRSGERYILGGENISFRDFFDVLSEVYGVKRRLVKLSAPTLKSLAVITWLFSHVTGKTDLISGKWIDKYLQNQILSSNKAVKELTYSITPFEEGVKRTVEWLKKGDKLYGK